MSSWVCSSVMFGGAGLGGEPFFEGLVEAFDLATRGGVAQGGVDLGDAQAAQFVFEVVAAAFATGEAGGEDHAVVGQGRGRNAMGGTGFAVCDGHDRAGDAAVGGDREGVAGVVVEPVEDFVVLLSASHQWVKSACQRSGYDPPR